MLSIVRFVIKFGKFKGCGHSVFKKAFELIRFNGKCLI
jgi:hypothetical protein